MARENSQNIGGLCVSHWGEKKGITSCFFLLNGKSTEIIETSLLQVLFYYIPQKQLGLHAVLTDAFYK